MTEQQQQQPHLDELVDFCAREVVRDCRQARMAVVESFLEAYDVMRSRLPTSSCWTKSRRVEMQRAVLQVVAACHDVADEMFIAAAAAVPVPTPPRPQPQPVKKPAPPPPPSRRPKPGLPPQPQRTGPGHRDGVPAAAAVPASTHDQLMDASLQLLHTLLGDKDNKVGAELASPAEALWLLHDGVLAHLEHTARFWALRTVETEQRRFLSTPTGAEYHFLRKSGMDEAGGKTSDAPTRYAALKQEYDKRVRELSPDTSDAGRDKDRMFFQSDALTEAALYHHPYGNTLLGSGSVESEELRPPNVSWQARTEMRNLVVDADARQRYGDRLMEACFFSGHLPSPLPEGLGGDGYRLSLPSVVHASGFLPTVVVAAAAGRLPWVVDAGSSGKWVAWLQAEENQAQVWDKETARTPEFWLHVVDTMRTAARPTSQASAPTSSSSSSSRMVKEFRAAGLLEVGPARSRLATLDTRTSGLDDMEARVRQLADDLLLEGTLASGPVCVRGYLETLLPAGTGTETVRTVVSNLLRFHLQLPLAHVLQQRQQQPLSSALDADALQSIMGLILTYETLLALLHLLAGPGGVEHIVDENGDEDGALTVYHEMVVRFAQDGRTRLPPYLLQALAEVGKLVDETGVYGVVPLTTSSATPHFPLVRRVSVELAVLGVRARLALLQPIFRAHLTDWRNQESGLAWYWERFVQGARVVLGVFKDVALGPTSSAGASSDLEREQVRALLPTWFRFGMAPSVLRIMGQVTVGAALYASVPLMCGLSLSPPEEALAEFCVTQAVRGGIPAKAVGALVRLTSREGDPRRRVGVPTLMAAGKPLDAQMAVWRWLRSTQAAAAVLPALHSLGTPAPIGKWVESVLLHVKEESDLAQASPPMLFLNAVTLKYVLRTALQQLPDPL